MSKRLAPMTLALVATLLFACVAPSTQAPTQAPVARDELRIALTCLGNEALNPILATNQDIQQMALVFDPIIGMDLEGIALSKETGVAKDWQLSADGLVYSLSLRSGVKFHNGDDVTADDVKFTVERLSGPKVTTNEGPTISRAIASITVKGPTEIEVRLKKPDPLFLRRLSPLLDVSGFVVPKKYVQQVGDDAFALKPVGSGPYKLVDRQVGASITYELAFPDHFAVGKPRFKRVVMRLVAEESTRIAQLQSDAADVADISVEGLGLLAKPGLRVFTGRTPELLNMVPVTNKPEQATQDINLRRALSYAIDRDQLNRFLLQGKATPTGNVFPGQIGGGGPIPPHPFDPQKAREFLSMTSFGPGRKALTLQMPVSLARGWPMQRLGEAVQSMWKTNLGIDTRVIPLEQGAFNAQRNAATFPPQSVVLQTSPGSGAIWNSFARGYLCSQTRKYACDPEFDKLSIAWDNASTEGEYNRLAVDVEKYMVGRLMNIPLLAGYATFVANTEVVPEKFGDTRVAGGRGQVNVRGLVAGK